MKIQWYASDKADTSIIAYGVKTENPKPADSKKGDDFKITYKHGEYNAYMKHGKSFVLIGSSPLISSAKQFCEITLIEFI